MVGVAEFFLSPADARARRGHRVLDKLAKGLDYGFTLCVSAYSARAVFHNVSLTGLTGNE